MTTSKEFVRIVEVGPRDGLQNEATALSPELKAQLVDRLAAAGIAHIEAGSFVSPKWVPQMANSDQVFSAITRRPGVRYSALTPNLKGFEGACAAGVDEVAIFTAATESFCQRNINCSIAESLERFQPLMEAARERGMPVRGYVSCVLGCPYEGKVAPERVLDLTLRLLDMGCHEVSLGDTIGVGTPRQAANLIRLLTREVDVKRLAVHFHDTYGQALANLYASLEQGIRVVDSSVAGLGGCPYAPGASGNLATEDALYLLEGCGFETGIDLNQVIDTGLWISQQLQRESRSKVALARRAACR